MTLSKIAKELIIEIINNEQKLKKYDTQQELKATLFNVNYE